MQHLCWSFRSCCGQQCPARLLPVVPPQAAVVPNAKPQLVASVPPAGAPPVAGAGAVLATAKARRRLAEVAVAAVVLEG